MRIKYERGRLTEYWGQEIRTNTGLFFPKKKFGMSASCEILPEEDRLDGIRKCNYFEPLICSRSAIVKMRDNGLEPGINNIQLVILKRPPRHAEKWYEFDETGRLIGFSGGLYEGLRLLLINKYKEGYRYAYLKPA